MDGNPLDELGLEALLGLELYTRFRHRRAPSLVARDRRMAQKRNKARAERKRKKKGKR